jgi:hypothetical protein
MHKSAMKKQKKKKTQYTWHKIRHDKKVDVKLKKLWWKIVTNQRAKKCDETSQDANFDEAKQTWFF